MCQGGWGRVCGFSGSLQRSVKCSGKAAGGLWPQEAQHSVQAAEAYKDMAAFPSLALRRPRL